MTVSGILAIVLGLLIVMLGLVWFAWLAMLVGVAVIAAGVWIIVIGRRMSGRDQTRPAHGNP